jgi:hypothetical protein
MYVDSVYRNYTTLGSIDFVDKYLPSGYLRENYILGPGDLVAMICAPHDQENGLPYILVLFTLNKKVLARIPFPEMIRDAFFDNQGNVYQSIVTEGSSVDSIAEFPTAQLLRR